MDTIVQHRVNLAIAWLGPAFVVGYVIFWGILGSNIPPPNMMGLSASELVAHYTAHQQSIAIGMAVSMGIAFFYLPWCCLLSGMMHDDKDSTNVLSRMELTGGTLTAWSLGFCPAVWLVTAVFINELNPDTAKAFHVFGWFIYDMTWGITTVQCIGVGLWTVLNKRQTIFPAWAGWATIATGTNFAALTVLPWIKSGPFAVSGTWNFFVVFGSWLFAFFGLYSYFMIKELRRRLHTSSSVPDALANA
jgi:hypothetical protein